MKRNKWKKKRKRIEQGRVKKQKMVGRKKNKETKKKQTENIDTVCL